MSSSDVRRAGSASVVPRERVTVAAPVSPTTVVREIVAAGELDGVLERARAEARRIGEAALAEKDRIVTQAQAEGREAGHREGYAEGLRVGREEAMAATQREAEAMLALLDEELARLREGAVMDLARLAVQVASRLYMEQIEADPDHAAIVVRTLLAETSPNAAQIVEVNALDLPHVLKARHQWASAQPGLSDIRIVPSAELARGACRVLTDGGWLERDWPQRLEDLVALWAGAVRGGARP